MTPEQLRATGEALYGSRWQTEMAEALDVADRTIRRWLSGEKPIPEDLKERLLALVTARQAQLQAVAAMLG